MNNKWVSLGGEEDIQRNSLWLMTQDELWLKKYQEVKAFIETNHRNPSRHNPEERFKYCNWLKHNKKLLNAGEMKEDRVALFVNLLELLVRYRRVNQYE